MELTDALMIAIGVLTSTIAFLFYRMEKANKDRDQARIDCEKVLMALHTAHESETKTLHEAHKAEMRENGKALLLVSQQLVQAIERLSDLEEQRRR